MTWETTTLGSISGNIQTGPFGSQLHQSDYSELGTPVVMPKDLVQGKISEETIARVSEEHVVRLPRHKIQNGDILYSRRGDVGRCAYATEKEEGWLCGTGCLRVTIDTNKADSKFVFYQLQLPTIIGWVENHAVGSTMLNLNTGILASVPLKLPNLSEQRKIASILSTYDELIENNRKQIKLLEEAAQRLYKEWFVDLRFPGHENVPVVDGVPEGWERKRIKEVVATTSGGTPSRGHAEYYRDGSFFWIKTKELDDGFIFETEELISEEAVNKSSAKILKTGSIILAMYGATIGKLGITTTEMTCNQACCVFDMSTFKNGTEFLFCWLLEHRNFLIHQGKGAAQPNLSQEMIKNFEIILPDIQILEKFSNITSELFALKSSFQKKILLLKSKRDAILPKLTNGEIEV